MKIIEIDTCQECPYYNVNGRFCKQTREPIIDFKIGESCPLPEPQAPVVKVPSVEELVDALHDDDCERNFRLDDVFDCKVIAQIIHALLSRTGGR